MTPRNNAGPFVFDGSAPDLPSLGELYFNATTTNDSRSANEVGSPCFDEAAQQRWRRDRERRNEGLQ